MLPGTHLLIDGKNILYRAVFVETRDSPVEVFFRVILNAVKKSSATNCHVFWDCPRKEVWRKKVLPQYKENRNKKSDPEIGELIGKMGTVLQQICTDLGFRQYYAKTLEADDLIYAFTSLYHPSDIVVLSSDTDLLQIPFRFANTRQLKPGKDSEFFDRPVINPVIRKCLEGDKSDNIPGYNGIGPVKSEKLAKCPHKLYEFVSKDPRTFYFNMNIVDLAQSPFQMRAQHTVMHGMQQQPRFNLNAARGVLSKHSMYPKIHEMNWSIVSEHINENVK